METLPHIFQWPGQGLKLYIGSWKGSGFEKHTGDGLSWTKWLIGCGEGGRAEWGVLAWALGGDKPGTEVVKEGGLGEG